MAAFGPARLFFDGVHIRSCGNGGWRFRPYGESLLTSALKVTKSARPERTAPRQGSGFLRSGIHPGALPSGWLRCTYMQCVRLRRTALRAHPRMNTSTQPAEGAGGSRSRAAGELTLGLMSGEEHGCTPINCRSWLASEGGLPADQSLAGIPGSTVGAGLPAKAASQPTNPSQMYPNPGRSWLASDGGLSANPFLTDVPSPIVGASLLAMTDLQSTLFIAQAIHSDHSHKIFSLLVGSPISSLCSSLSIQRPGLQARQ
ncbi:hypothetical protein PMI31_03642 [Pseudomonas sp. GM55]|nr:hypothetical protein PMI31_03642 [Pseudomonas sp. GM55]